LSKISENFFGKIGFLKFRKKSPKKCNLSINHASRRRVDFFGPFFSRGIFGGFRGIFGTFFAKTASYRLVEKNPKNVKKVSKFFRKFSKKKKSINSASQRGGSKNPKKKVGKK